MFESPYTLAASLPEDDFTTKKKPLPRTPEAMTHALYAGAEWLNSNDAATRQYPSLSCDSSLGLSTLPFLDTRKDALAAPDKHTPRRPSIQDLYDWQTPLPNEPTTLALHQPASLPMYQMQSAATLKSNTSQSSLISRHPPPSRNASQTSFSIEGGAGWSETHFDRPSTIGRGDSLKIETPLQRQPSPPPPVPALPGRTMTPASFQKPFDPEGSIRLSQDQNDDRLTLSRGSSPIELHSPNTPDDDAKHYGLDEAVSSILLQKLGRASSPAHLTSRSPSPAPSAHSYRSVHVPERASSAALSRPASPHHSRANSFTSIPTLRLGPSTSSPLPPPPPVVPFPWASMSTSLPPLQAAPSLTAPAVPSPPNHPTLNDTAKSSFNIASFSLTHDKETIKTYRRMANKTRSKEVQMTYARYLLKIAALYENQKSTKLRLMQEASYWIDRLARANLAEALLIKGRWHLAEENTVYDKPSPNRALRCFLSAAKSGSVEAYFELAQLWKRRQKYSKAVANYKAAAAKGHPAATYKMAKILLRGQLEQDKNIEMGLDYLRQAADMSGASSAEPAFVLSCVYSDELECIGLSRDAQRSRRDIHRAMQYLRKATELGYADALYRMGHVHEQGLLAQPVDAWAAYHSFLHASQDDHPGAMLELARLFVQGIPGRLAPQPHEAFRWCQRAADKGYDKAEYTLATYFEDGIGTMPDYPRAVEYFGKAASKGCALAAGKLNRPMPVKTTRSSLDDEDDDADDDPADAKRARCYVM